MKLALTIAAFALLQASAPVPRVTIKNADGQNNASQDKGTPNPAPSVQAMSDNKPASPNPNQQTASSETGKYEKSPIFVRVLSHLSIEKDKADYISIGANLLLTLATLVIAAIAWKQASAAKSSAQAIINSERTWIVVSVESPEPNKFNFRATNVGKTPAKIKSIWNRPITFWRDSELEIPPDEKTGESLLSTPPCLLPPTDSQIILRCNIGELGPGQYVGPDAPAKVQNDIQKGFRMLYFYGRIIYSDTLDEKSLHETKWLYWYLPVGEGAEAIPDPRHPELNSYS